MSLQVSHQINQGWVAHLTSRNELFHWFLKQYITGYNNAPIPE